jgi:predicted DCC family thiol-disulfide oxidoreductase YuxK
MNLRLVTNSIGNDDLVQPNGWRVEVFYDGDCPLCSREVAWLRRRDTAGQIRFTNIAEPGFSPEALGTTMERLMGEIHGRRPDGAWLQGVDVFRELYGAAGHTWLVALSRLPGVSQLMGWGYRIFARNRLKLTGRCDAAGTSCRKNARS